MPRGVRASLNAGVSSITLLKDANQEILSRPTRIGDDATCGCPGRTAVRTIDSEYPAQQLEQLYPRQQYTDFIDSLNTTLEATHVPSCPLLLFSTCLPPLCCFWYYLRHSRSRTRIESFREIMAEENARLVRAGLGWSEPLFIAKPHCNDMCTRSEPELRGSIQLQMDLNARTQFELDNPQAFQYLGQLLLQRTETQQSAIAVGAATPGGKQDASSSDSTIPSPTHPQSTSETPSHIRPVLSHTKSIELDASQKKLVHRASIIRRASITNTASRTMSGAPLPMATSEYSPLTPITHTGPTPLLRAMSSSDAKWAEQSSNQSTTSMQSPPTPQTPFTNVMPSGPTNEMMI